MRNIKHISSWAQDTSWCGLLCPFSKDIVCLKKCHVETVYERWSASVLLRFRTANIQPVLASGQCCCGWCWGLQAKPSVSPKWLHQRLYQQLQYKASLCFTRWVLGWGGAGEAMRTVTASPSSMSQRYSLIAAGEGVSLFCLLLLPSA